MQKVYRIGTRKSSLALKQVGEVLTLLKKFYPDFKAEIIGIDTWGDKNKQTPISEIEGSDFFTKEIDEALLKGKIDFGVHSAKDLPERIKEGLKVVAITESIDPYDVLVSKDNLTLEELPYKAKIGTSSKRRKEGLLKYRGDFKIVDIRGNIEERLKLVDGRWSMVNSKNKNHQPILDAIVIAAAGLIRLGLEYKITQKIPFEIIRPHPLQGCLAVVGREEDLELANLLSVLNARRKVYEI